MNDRGVVQKENMFMGMRFRIWLTSLRAETFLLPCVKMASSEFRYYLRGSLLQSPLHNLFESVPFQDNFLFSKA